MSQVTLDLLAMRWLMLLPSVQLKAEMFTNEEQNQVCATLSNLKNYLKQTLQKKWMIQQGAKYTTVGFRREVLQDEPSNLKLRVGTPRPLQTLLSRFRVDRLESAGTYPRKLQNITNPVCRLCGYPKETILHLLSNCIGTDFYRQSHNLSVQTLESSTLASMVKIANFNEWIRWVGYFDHRPPDYRVQATLVQLRKEKKRKQPDNEIHEFKRPTKRNCLVIPDLSLLDTYKPIMIRKLL